jgi:hypothetical protein
MSSDIQFGRIDIEVDLVKVTGMHCMNQCCALKHSRGGTHEKQFIWDHNPTKVRFTNGAFDYFCIVEAVLTDSFCHGIKREFMKLELGSSTEQIGDMLGLVLSLLFSDHCTSDLRFQGPKDY